MNPVTKITIERLRSGAIILRTEPLEDIRIGEYLRDMVRSTFDTINGIAGAYKEPDIPQPKAVDASLGQGQTEEAYRAGKIGPDPWKHRSIGMKCKTCMWFVDKEKAQSPDDHKRMAEIGTLGRCRRHSPTHDGYPAVFESDWCGDHKLDENKVQKES